MVKDAQGQDWGRDPRKQDVPSEGAGAGDVRRRGVGVTRLAPLGVGGGLSVPCVRSFLGHWPFPTRRLESSKPDGQASQPRAAGRAPRAPALLGRAGTVV